MSKQRRKHTAEFKALVALEALKGIETASEIAARFELHPVQVSDWKRELISNAKVLFDRKNAKADTRQLKQIEALERKVGQLSMEVDWLGKKSVQLGLPKRGRS